MSKEINEFWSNDTELTKDEIEFLENLDVEEILSGVFRKLEQPQWRKFIRDRLPSSIMKKMEIQEKLVVAR